MAKFDLTVDSALKRNLTRANSAFSNAEYPEVEEVVDVLVMNRIAAILELSAHLIERGEATLKTVFLNWLQFEDDTDECVILLHGVELSTISLRLDVGYGVHALKDIEEMAKKSLARHGLLKPLEAIGIKVSSYYAGTMVKSSVTLGDY